jgi:hypothetical protein
MKSDKDPELLFQLLFFKFHGKGAQPVRFVFVLGVLAIVGLFVSRWF